jgi:hypothetical protein
MVRRFLNFLIPVFSLFALTGCAALAGLMPGGSSSSTSTTAAPAAAAATGSVPSVLDQVEPSTKLAMFSPSALLDGSTSLDDVIVQSQCDFRTAAPPFLVPTTVANKSWTFTGRVEVPSPGKSKKMRSRSNIVVGSGSGPASSNSIAGR